MEVIMEQNILKHIRKAVDEGFSYLDYRAIVEQLVLEGESTGKEQTEALTNYSLLNHKRMKRLDKTTKLSPDVIAKLQSLKEQVTWVVITESWCGDAAQTLPIINKLAEATDKIHLKIVLRDENEELMDNFLTNGSRSIPKLIMLDKGLCKVLDVWGPRPSIATNLVQEYKEKHGGLSPEFKESLQVWYNKNKGENTIEDLLELLSLK